MSLILQRSKYSIDLSNDLDDAAVFVLIEHGLGNRFPAPCISWRSCNAKSKETMQKSIYEGKRQVDEQLKNGQSLLEDTLTREIMRRILDACPYVTLSDFYWWDQDSNNCIVHLT